MEMNALSDLYEFIDKEEVYNRDYFVPNVLKCFENDGKLFSLPNRFYVDLGIMGKKKFLGNADEWTFEKKLDMLIDPPIEIEIENDSKYTRFYGADMHYIDWVDFENASCDFKSESFCRYLN